MAELYRVLKRLTTGHAPNTERCLAWDHEFRAEYIPRLVEVGALALVAAPRLDQVPRWKARAKRLQAHGVITATDFLAATDRELADMLGIKTLEPIRKRKAELWRALLPTEAGTGARR